MRVCTDGWMNGLYSGTSGVTLVTTICCIPPRIIDLLLTCANPSLQASPLNHRTCCVFQPVFVISARQSTGAVSSVQLVDWSVSPPRSHNNHPSNSWWKLYRSYRSVGSVWLGIPLPLSAAESVLSGEWQYFPCCSPIHSSSGLCLGCVEPDVISWPEKDGQIVAGWTGDRLTQFWGHGLADRSGSYWGQEGRVIECWSVVVVVAWRGVRRVQGDGVTSHTQKAPPPPDQSARGQINTLPAIVLRRAPGV